jgi:hypothetical protein
MHRIASQNDNWRNQALSLVTVPQTLPKLSSAGSRVHNRCEKKQYSTEDRNGAKGLHDTKTQMLEDEARNDHSRHD